MIWWWVSSNDGASGNVAYPFLCHRSQIHSGLEWEHLIDLSMGQIEIERFWHLSCILMLNWIVWNGTVLYAKWIVWNRIVLTSKLYVRKTKLFEIELFWHLTVCKQKLYLYKIELFELELFDLTEYLEIEMFLTINLCTYAKLNCLK